MRNSALLVTLLAFPAFASDPGEPLDCTDWVFLSPGLSCAVYAPPPQPGGPDPQVAWRHRGDNIVVDNDGYQMIVQNRSGTGFDDRIELLRFDGVTETVLGYVESRRVNGDPNYRDRIQTKRGCTSVGTEHCWGSFPALEDGFSFDRVHGRLLLPLRSWCYGNNCPTPYSQWWIAEISGFTTLNEIRQTFAPPGAVSFRVPVWPEDLDAADFFDTYYGTLATVGDWSQARALECGYPASPPSAGDYLEIADTVPDPNPGQGYYYVTAVTFAGETRYGRERDATGLHGRSPSLLPSCQ